MPETAITIMESSTKICSKCNAEKHVDEFARFTRAKAKVRVVKRSSWCRACKYKSDLARLKEKRQAKAAEKAKTATRPKLHSAIE
jgi:hypothetical protein